MMYHFLFCFIFFICFLDFFLFFFFNDTATTEIYTLSLHDALPISFVFGREMACSMLKSSSVGKETAGAYRSEEHTSELQSRPHLVCRLLLEKKKKNKRTYHLRIHQHLLRSLASYTRLLSILHRYPC